MPATPSKHKLFPGPFILTALILQLCACAELAFAQNLSQLAVSDSDTAETSEFVDILTPRTAERFTDRGLVRSRVGDLKGAMSDFDKALELDPKCGDAFSGRGYLKLYTGDTNGALADFESAVACNPADTSAYCGRGQAKSDLGHEKEAAADFDYAIKLDPKNAPSYIFRGYHLGRYGETLRAIADYDQTIKLDPTNALAYCYRASAREAIKDNRGAVADFNEVLKSDPQYAWAYYWRGHARNELGDRKGAISDYNEYIRLKPDDAWGFRGRGWVRQKSGELKAAIQDYTKAISLDPTDAWTYSARGFLLGKLGNTKGSIADYRKAAKLEKENSLQKTANKQTSATGKTGTGTSRASTTAKATTTTAKVTTVRGTTTTAKATTEASTTRATTTSEEPAVELITDPDVYRFSEKTLHDAQRAFGKPRTTIKQLLIFHRPGPHCQTVMWDADKGIFCIFMANKLNDNYFQGNLGHELVHLLNAKLCDPYIEGLCTVFGENTISEEDPKRQAYTQLVLSTPFYAETYSMMKELRTKIDQNSYNTIMNFATFDTQKQWMHIDTDAWLKSMPESDRLVTSDVINKYCDGIKSTMPTDGTYVFAGPSEPAAPALPTN